MSDVFSDQGDDQIPDNAYEVLVGDGKKFKDNDALAKSKLESDNFIKKLQAENAMLKTEVGAAKKLEDFFKEVNKPSANTEADKPQESQQVNVDVEALVSQALEKRLAQQSAVDNLTNVTNTLSQRYGDQTAQAVAQKAAELGVTKEYLRDVAARTPKVFLKLFDDVKQQPQKDVFSAGPQSRVDVLKQPVGNVRNEAYWQALRVRDRKTYDSPAAANQRMNDALSMGESFFTKG